MVRPVGGHFSFDGWKEEYMVNQFRDLANQSNFFIISIAQDIDARAYFAMIHILLFSPLLKYRKGVEYKFSPYLQR